jgi:hypothetical protein
LDEDVHFVGESPQVVRDAFSDFDHFSFDLKFVLGFESFKREGSHDAIADDQRDQTDMRHQERRDIAQVKQTLALWLLTAFDAT